MLEKKFEKCFIIIMVGITAHASLLIIANAAVAPSEEWNKTLGGTTLDGANPVLRTGDGGNIISSYTNPESRFVWEPGENLTFTWTAANFDGFYYDPKGRTGNESLTINIVNIKDRYIPKEGIVYSTMAGIATARFPSLGEYYYIDFMGERYFAGYPEGRGNISEKSGLDLNRLQYILIDDDASYILAEGSTLPLKGNYLLEIKEADTSGSQVTFLLRWEGTEVDKKTISTGKNYTYELKTGSFIAVHIDSIFEEKGTSYAIVKGIFQISNHRAADEGYVSGVLKKTKVSNGSIIKKNSDSVDIRRGSIIEIIGDIKLKVVDTDTLRLLLYRDSYEERIHRGAAGSYGFSGWDGLNYAGFQYDAESGNYSESIVITNMTGRMIHEGGLTYTSYIRRVPYAAFKAAGQKGTEDQYVLFSIGGKKYTPRNDSLAELLIAHGYSISEKKSLVGKPSWYEESDGFARGLPSPWEPGMDTWELGEGYSLTVRSIDTISNPRKALLVLSRDDIEIDKVWLSSGNTYTYFKKNGMPKFVTYLDAVFAGATVDMIQLRYTWFVSGNLTHIKEGDRLGVFNVTDVKTDRIVLTNREPIELKAGSSINLFGNLSFFVENSSELRFYPTNMAGTQRMPEDVNANSVLDLSDTTTPVITPFVTTPVTDITEKAAGFEAVLAITIFLAVCKAGRKKR